MRGVLHLRLLSWARDADVNTSAVNISTIVTLTWAGGRSLQVISVVMPELSVAVCVVFRFGGVGSGGSHPVQIKLVMVRVHGLSVRLVLIIFVLAVCRLSAVIAHIRHRRLGESRGVLGVRVATHRSWKIGQNARNLLLIGLPGAHGKKTSLHDEGKVRRGSLPFSRAQSTSGSDAPAYNPLKLSQLHNPDCSIAAWETRGYRELGAASSLARLPFPLPLSAPGLQANSAFSYFICTHNSAWYIWVYIYFYWLYLQHRRSDRFSVRSLQVGL